MDIEDENGHIHIKPQGILWFRLLLSTFRFRHGFVKLFCCCPCRICAKFKDRSKPGRLPVTLFRNSSNTYALTDKHHGNGCSQYTTTESVDDASSSPVNHKKGRRNSAEYL